MLARLRVTVTAAQREGCPEREERSKCREPSCSQLSTRARFASPGRRRQRVRRCYLHRI